MKKFGFDKITCLSTRPKNAMGTDEGWEKATTALNNALIHRTHVMKSKKAKAPFMDQKLNFISKILWDESGNAVRSR